jgi:hypothetical protein
VAQHRDAPAYQEYAASMMARTDYRLLSLEARGLLYSMRLECWVNGCVEGRPDVLARVLGYPQEQVERALRELAPFFKPSGDKLRSPELDDYRTHLEDRRQRQSEGGRTGAAMTNGARQRTRPATPPGRARVGRESLVKPSPVQESKTQAIEGGAKKDEWVNDYERASRGH